MGGGKSTSSKRGGGSVSQVRTQAGLTVDLEKPLVYSDPKHGMTKSQLQELERFENKNRNRKSEYGLVLDANGNVLGEKRGEKGRISMYRPAGTEVFAHTHPRGDGGDEPYVGGTFSTGDLRTFSLMPEKTMIATASEARYSMTKGKNFDAQGLVSYGNKMYDKRRKEYTDRWNKAKNKYKNGDISYSEFAKEASDAFNTHMVDFHNDLLAGQKRYGYTYGAERRK